MRKCNWFTIKELVTFHSLLALWKVLKLDKPEQLHEKFTIHEDFLISTSPARLMTTATGWRWRTVPEWNSLSQELRNCNKLNIFKNGLKKHLLSLRVRPHQADLSMSEDTDDSSGWMDQMDPLDWSDQMHLKDRIIRNRIIWTIRVME